MNMEHRGQIVIASVLDIIYDTHYTHVAKLKTGSFEGQACYVVYKGDPNYLEGKDIVVRLEVPNRNSTLSLDESATSTFVTSARPNRFEYASSRETILYGIWEERMKRGFTVPIFPKILNYYDIGIPFFILHYALQDGKVVPYNLFRKSLDASKHEDTGFIRGIESALRSYLIRLNNSENPQAPILVTIDEDLNLERILAVFNNAIANTGNPILWQIEMEPQR